MTVANQFILCTAECTNWQPTGGLSDVKEKVLVAQFCMTNYLFILQTTAKFLYVFVAKSHKGLKEGAGTTTATITTTTTVTGVRQQQQQQQQHQYGVAKDAIP